MSKKLIVDVEECLKDVCINANEMRLYVFLVEQRFR